MNRFFQPARVNKYCCACGTEIPNSDGTSWIICERQACLDKLCGRTSTTRKEDYFQLDTIPIPRHILDRLTLHVSLDLNGKPIFTRRLQPSVELVENYIVFTWRDEGRMANVSLPNRVLSACLPLKKQGSKSWAIQHENFIYCERLWFNYWY